MSFLRTTLCKTGFTEDPYVNENSRKLTIISESNENSRKLTTINESQRELTKLTTINGSKRELTKVDDN